MGIRIGHASRPEGSGVNGNAGDQTGKEVCIRQFYSMPADFVAIHPDAAVRERHARACEAGCANDNIGYSQFGADNRNTLNTLAKQVGYDLSKITKKCNTDCSAFMNVCAVASGASGVSYGGNGWVTSNMRAALKAAGYKIITEWSYITSDAYAVRGAIYVKESQHTFCALDNGSKAKQMLKAAGIESGDSSSASSGNAGQTSNTGSGLSKTPKWKGVVDVDDSTLNVRKWAGTEYDRLKSYPQLNKGEEVEVCDSVKAKDGSTWYYIRIKGKTFGFVHSAYIKKAEEEKAETGKEKTAKIEVGDTVKFTGAAHYTSSYASGKKKTASPCEAKVTNKSEGKPHPYHLVGQKVHGWVDASDVTK